MAELKKGDKVTWSTPQGKTSGKVTQKVTNDTTVAGHKAKASDDDPQYKVKSDTTGKEAVHKPNSLNKK